MPATDTKAAGQSQTLRWVLLAVVAVLLAAGVTFLIKGVNTTSRPTADTLPSRADTSAARPSRVSGFEQIAFTIHSTTRKAFRHCGLLATTTAQQDQGLMNRRDLAGYDAMVFQFAAPTTVEFYMKDTLIPLSIAWYDASGKFVSATDMTPCPTQNNCPLYAAAAPYTDAVEVAQGQLGHLGAGPGTTLTVGGSC